MLELCQKLKKLLLTLFQLKTIKIGAKLTRGVEWMNENGAIAIVGQECGQWFVAFHLLFHKTCLVNSLISQNNQSILLNFNIRNYIKFN